MKVFWLSLKSALYLGAFLLVAAGWLPLRIFERRPHLPAAWALPQFVGVALALLALGVLATCVTIFVKRGRGTIAPFDPPVKFVRRGPYKWVRNPIYLALLVLVAGQALFFASWHITVYWVCLACALHLFVVTYEEDALRRQFGAMYEDYKREVSRWLPRQPKPMLQTIAPFEIKR